MTTIKDLREKQKHGEKQMTEDNAKYTEIEAKLRVPDLEPVTRRLAELNAEFIEDQDQRDQYLDLTSSELTHTDKCLRIRCERVSNQPRRTVLTYKGPKQTGAYKKRREVEVRLESEDRDALEALLAELDYHPALVVHKKRSLWKYNDCLVGLDQVTDLGCFVEIEGPSEEIIADVQKLLHLQDCPHESRSYACLLQEKSC